MALYLLHYIHYDISVILIVVFINAIIHLHPRLWQRHTHIVNDRSLLRNSRRVKHKLVGVTNTPSLITMRGMCGRLTAVAHSPSAPFNIVSLQRLLDGPFRGASVRFVQPKQRTGKPRSTWTITHQTLTEPLRLATLSQGGLYTLTRDALSILKIPCSRALVTISTSLSTSTASRPSLHISGNHTESALTDLCTLDLSTGYPTLLQV